jgi:hypothetical protein
MTPEMNEESKEFGVKPTELPGVQSLFSEGWNYVKNNLWLVALLSAPFLVTDVLAYLAVLNGGSFTGGLSFLEAIVSLGALVVYMLFMATVLHMVVHQSVFAAGFAWAKQHILSLVWISILTMAIVIGGFVLLIIPGIIVAVYISLSQIVLAAEGKKGMAALMRSRELVSGNWMTIFLKIVGVQLLYLLTVVLFGVVVGLTATYFTNEAFGEFVTNLLFTVLGSIGTLIFLTVTMRLYTGLRARFDEAATPIAPASGKYTALGWFGLLFPLVVVPLLAVGIMSSMTGSYDGEASAQNRVLKESLQYTQFEAEQYYTQQPQLSYAGVCAEISEYLEEKGTVVCNDSAEAYAVSVTAALQTFCADSTGYNKIIYTDLDQRTQCIELGEQAS